MQSGATSEMAFNSVAAPKVPICGEDWSLFKAINAFVCKYMSQPGHDNSHDYLHILRIVSNANKLLEAELEVNLNCQYDTSALFLAALLHDVGDHKYSKPEEDVENGVSEIMRERGASSELALKVQTIVKHVGWTNEKNDPQSVVDVLAKYPELAIVQDADRLDAIGAIGVARCFAYGGAWCQGQPMADSFDIYEGKLYKLPEFMKTKAGKQMALSRRDILKAFEEQFLQEAQLSFDLE